MLTTERDREINEDWNHLTRLEEELSACLRLEPPLDWRLLRPLWRELAMAWAKKCRTAIQTGAEVDEITRCARYAMSYILDAENARIWADQ